MSARFDLEFFRVFSKYRLPGKLFFLPFFTRNGSSPDRKMIKLQDHSSFLVGSFPET